MNLTGEPIGNGIMWSLAENCDQYTLTVINFFHFKSKRSNLNHRIFLEGTTGTKIRKKTEN